MKKHLLFLVALLAATMTLNARVILIDEGFENGIQDSVWTQEFADGDTPWAVEDVADNIAYPSTMVQGNKRAYLRNNTGETIGYTTRLVSKAMDLRSIHFPELTFWYANPKWGADRDTLRVLYRTSKNAKWKQLAEIGDAHSDWQRLKVSLPEVSQTYQIAFEGKDNLGHGIVLDSVVVQSAPDCTMPYDLMATSKGAGRVTLAWVANFDAYYYELIVTQDTIDPNMIDEIEAETPEKIVYHGLVAEDWSYDLTLESGEFYLAYVRSLCGDENSAWSSETEEGPFGFRVRTTRQVPFTEKFNYQSGVFRDEDWSWGGNMPTTNPFVNSATRGDARANYSPDTTAAVVFSGGTTSQLTTVLPASRYIYLATPALTDSTNDDFRVNQCQVHFWSTVYTCTGRQYGRSIVVGVMDDPDDIKTFTPVDTVTVWGNKTFQENIVDLSSYQGYGAFVAFVSNFDRENLFFMDNMTIEYRKDVNKVTKISVNPRDTYATIEWEGNASSYNVLVTNAEVNPNNPAAEAIVAQATVNTNRYRCTSLEPNHSWNRPYYVYVKAAGTEWSYRYPFVTIAPTREIPYTFSFESNATTKYTIPGVSGQFAEGLGIFGNNGSYPAVSVGSANSYAGSGYLFLSKRGGADAWITLPMVENMSEVQVKFYLNGGTTFNQAHATLGVMTNPMDINTFVPVSHFTLNTSGYTRCYANFENYSGPDGVIAIMWDDVMRMTENTINYIDEIIVEELSDCVPPTNIDLEVEPDSLTVRWDVSSANDWEFFLSRSAIKESDRANKTFDEIAAMGGVTVAENISWTNPSMRPVFGFGGLVPHATYYLYVRATCDMGWWSEAVFTTPCRDEPYPYKETFETYNLGGTSAGCWQLADYMGVGYPVISQAGTITSSNKALELYSSGTIHRSVAILPIIQGNYADMLLSFDVRTKESGATGVVIVGTMEDITNSNSFVPFDTVTVTGNTFKKVRFFLSNYDLVYEHLAITSGLGSLMMSSDIMIDNVELKDPTCLEAYDYQQLNFAPHTIDLTWSGMSDNDRWQLKVLKSNVDVNAVKNNTYNHSLELVSDTVFTGKNFHLAGLQAQQTYYAYVRALCGDSIWTTTPISTSCERINPTKPNKENFESFPSGTSYSESYVPTCWTSGNADPTATTYYLPYIYSSISYSNSGANTFRIYGTSTYNPAYVISPELECDSITQVAVTFNMYCSTSYTWICGVMTDPNDLSTFVTVDSVKGTGSSVQYTYDLSEYTGTLPVSAKYFAWRTPYGTTSTAYLDDVSFISVACPLTKPSISELTGNSVRVSGGLRTSDPWILMITNRAISDANLANESYVVPASNLVYLDTISRRSTTVNGLEPQTKYYVYTATLCDDTIKSQWNSLQFTTPCQAITPEEMGTITFSDKEGFETGANGEKPCWTVGSKTPNASSTYIPYIEATASTMHNGYNYLRMYDYSSSSSSTVGAYAIMPELDVDSISKYQVNFWGRSNSSTTYNNQVIVGVITDPSDLNTFVAVDTLNLSRTAWDPYSVGFENYEGDYMGDLGRYIMFLSDFGMSNYAYISEISVDLIPHCRPISSFSVDSVGEDAAIVSWKGYQDTYRVLVSPRALTEAEKPNYHYLIDTVVTSSENFLLEGLEPTTNYFVYAQGICENGDSTAISIVYAAVRTTCPTTSGVPVPFYDDFESYELDDDSPGCWQFLYTGAYSSWFAVKQVSSNGSKAIDVYSSSNNAYAVLPKVDANLEDLKLSFDARQYSGSSAQMYVGVMNDVNDVSTFVLLETFDLAASDAFTHCQMSLGEYDLPYDNLVITAGIQNVTPSRYDVYMDNVGLEYESSCNAPKLKFLGSSFETAELSLTPSKKEDGMWQIVVIPESEYDLISNITSYLNNAEKITLDTTYIELTGLQPATSYYIFARTVCSEAETSTWTRNPLKINTQFYYENSYFFGFEHTGELWQRSMYSESDNYYLHPALAEGRDEQGEESQSYLYYPHSRENTDTYLYARPLSTNNVGALLMHARGNLYGGYVIFPSVDVASARSFEFKLRPGYLNKATMLPVASTDAAVEIGTIEKGKSFETYQALATIRVDQLDPTVSAKSKNNYLFSNYTLDLDSATIATRQIVFHMPKQPQDSAYLFIDDVKLDESKGFSLVALNKVVADGESALIEWASVGGPWNLTVTDESGTPVAQYANLTATSQLIENLQPQTNYTATLTAASVPTAAKSYITSDKLAFRTLCQAIEPTARGEFQWDFDNPYEWEENDILGGDDYDSLYYKPACFHVGITYDAPVNGAQWFVQRKGYETAGALSPYNSGRHYEVGRNDSYSMRVHTTNTAYNSYLILPELNCNLDTMMIEFYGRCFVSYDRNYGTPSSQGKIVETTYLGNAYSQSIVIGTLTDPNDFSTLQVLDTLSYTHTNLTINDNVNDDPSGLRYWELMRAPLERARGKYIVLFQPAPGLFYLDDLSVKPVGNTLFAPTGTRTSNITTTSATVTWNTHHPELTTVVILLNAAGEEVAHAAVTGTSYELTNLQPAMSYSWYVYQTDGSEESPSTKPVQFATECVALSPEYTCGFEPIEGWKVIEGQSSAYTQSLCWTYGDAAQNTWANVNYDPYNQANTRDFKYSFSGTHALMMRASYSTRSTYQPYVAMPAMDIAAYDTLLVSFWMRPAYVSALNDSVVMTYTGSTYSKSVIVGTMTDPTDASTFVAIDTITYDGTLSTSNGATAANNFLFQQAKVELTGATGPYIAFMTSFYQKGSQAQKTGDYIWLDEIAFERISECKTPKDLTALQVGTYHATLSWDSVDAAGSYLLQVSTDPYFADERYFVFNDVVESNTFTVKGLSQLTTYVWRVQSLCDGRWPESSFSTKATFKTARSPYFMEPFTTTVNASDWTFSKSHAENILDAATPLTRGTDNWSFMRTTTSYGLEGPHYMAAGYSSDYHWMVTPTFYLPEEDSVHFSMDLALTACNTAHTATGNAVTENDMKDDYYFMIVVSDDGGASWKSANILDKWQNTNPEGKQLRDIPSTGMNVRYSLAAYAGKNVRIGLYREARTTGNTGIAIHVDNVRLGYFDKTVDYASACQYEDIVIGDIVLSGDDTEPGIHAYPQPYYASDAEAKAGKRDSVFQLEIEVFPAQETFYADTICEGETYTNYDFRPKSVSGIYHRKLQSVLHGCDSIVTLDLHVKERRYAENEVVSICLGETYTWHDRDYNRAGLYRDTTISSIGCDSIMTLLISYAEGGAAVQTFHDSSRVEIHDLPFTYMNILYPYADGQDPIHYPAGTPKGTYVDTVQIQGEACTNILVHTLVIYDRKDAIEAIGDGMGEARKVVYRDQMYIICNDEWYNALGQKVSDPRQ